MTVPPADRASDAPGNKPVRAGAVPGGVVLRTVALATLVLCALALRDTARVALTSHGAVRRPAGDAVARAIGGPLRTLHGSIEQTDAAHTPVANAAVEAILLREGRSYPMVEVLSDARGGFELAGLPEGRYEVVARAPGLARGIVSLTLHGATTHSVAMRLGPGAQIRGSLTDAARRDRPASPLVGAIVRAMADGGGDGPPYAARTDETGAFVLDGLPPGSYRVEVAQPGYEAVIRRAVPAPARALAMMVRQLASVHGIVRDGAAQPASTASVTIAGSGIWPARAASVRADGTFAIEGIPSGVYELRAARGDDVAEPLAPLLLDPGDARDVTLTVTPGATLDGVVVDAVSGRPIAGARLVVAEDALATAPRALVADGQGAFHVAGLLHRPHQISARAPGYVPRVGALATPSATPVRMELDRQVTLTGHVVDSRGAPVAGAQIEVTAIDLDGRSSWLTGSAIAFRDALFAAQQGGPRPLLPAGELGVMPGPVPIVPLARPGGVPGTLFTGIGTQGSGYVTDAEGRFRVDEVPPGVVTVSASHPAYVRGESAERAARAGESLDIAIVLHPGGTIDGRVLDEQGYPVAQQAIEVRLERDPMPRRVFSARDGTFRVPSVLGRVSIVALVGGRVGARAEADVGDDAVVPVTLSLDRNVRRVRGRVLDERGYPVAGAELSIAATDASLGTSHAVTSADGTFDVTALGTGTLAIDTRHPDFAPHSTHVTDVRNEITVTLDRGGGFSVTVDARACGASEASLDARTTCGPLHRPVHSQGLVQFDHVCPGRVTLVASAAGCVRVERSTTVAAGASGNVAAIELTAGGSAQGDVVDLHGDPVPGATVELEHAAPDATTGSARTDRRGAFSVADLPDGDQTLVAIHPLLGRSSAAPVRIWRGTIARGLHLRFDRDLAGATREAGRAPVVLVQRGDGRVEVGAVLADSTAARAGLQPGDMVVTLQTRAVHDAAEATRTLRGPEGDELTMEVERDGRRRTVRWTRGSR